MTTTPVIVSLLALALVLYFVLAPVLVLVFLSGRRFHVVILVGGGGPFASSVNNMVIKDRPVIDIHNLGFLLTFDGYL